YRFAAGALCMTTSRYAAKNVMARRDPRAAFFVDGGSRAVLMRGTLEVLDPLSLSNQVRAALAGPGLYLAMAEYALRNVPFVTGYLLAILRLPREWMPYNRIVLHLHPRDIEATYHEPFPVPRRPTAPRSPNATPSTRPTFRPPSSCGSSASRPGAAFRSPPRCLGSAGCAWLNKWRNRRRRRCAFAALRPANGPRPPMRS